MSQCGWWKFIYIKNYVGLKSYWNKYKTTVNKFLLGRNDNTEIETPILHTAGPGLIPATYSLWICQKWSLIKPCLQMHL